MLPSIPSTPSDKIREQRERPPLEPGPALRAGAWGKGCGRTSPAIVLLTSAGPHSVVFGMNC